MKTVRSLKFIFVFQLLFWSIHFLFLVEVMYGSVEIDYTIILGYSFILTLIGLIISSGFVQFYKRLKSKLSNINLIISTTLMVVLSSQIWLVGIRLVEKYYLGYFSIPYRSEFLIETSQSIITLSIWSIIYLLFEFTDRIKSKNIDLDKANMLAKNAQLDALRYQLNPHFLFNAFSSVRALIYQSPEDADSMIVKLSEFMRYSLAEETKKEVPLKEELQLIKNYFDIEKVRFKDKIEIIYDVDYIAEEYPIPSFLLIPIVENAVKYGVKSSQAPLQIKITAEIIESELFIAVKNSGEWVDNTKNNNGFGKGLYNIQQRLEHLYSNNYKFEINKQKDFVAVEIRISKVVGDE